MLILECFMTYVVTDNCIRCKYTDCVESAPWTAFTRARTFLSSIPTNASIAASASPMPGRGDQARYRAGARQVAENQRRICAIWPNITTKRDALPDAKDWDGVKDKFESQFSDKPGQGD